MQTLSFLLIEVIIRLCSQQKVGPILNKKDEYSPLILSQPKHQINSFDCQIECLTCQDQLCYKCWDGWNLINDECIQICGDGLLAINSIEQCDDGNDEFGDGCYDCQIEWCSHYCIDCELTQFPKCNQCQEYFQVVGESDCQPICGDEYVVEELEDCDGWDILYFDNYQAQCDENCQITCLPGCCQCVYGYCLDEGFYISPFDESFYSCDELLDISKLYYGTKEVQNYCEQTQYCYINQLNIECIYNNSYFVFSKKFDCLSNQLSYFYDICGDGIIGLTEDCDDGNLLNDDGCSIKCQNEYIPGEDITLNLIFQKRFIDKQYVEITFSQQVKLISNDIIFEDRIQQFDLYYLDEQDTQIFLSQVSYSITPIIEISLEEFRTIKYQLEITFFENQIQFYKQIPITGGYFYLLSGSTTLKSINENTVIAAKKCRKIGNALITSLEISGLLIFVFGKFTDCFEILDILQYQSFLRYVNITQPENLIYFFETFDQISLNSLFSNIQLFNFYTISIGYRYISSIGQFLQYQYNADLLSNLYGQFAQLIISIFILICLINYQKYFYKKCFTDEHFQILQEKNQSFLKYLAYAFYYLNKIFFQIGKLMSRQGYHELFLANVWDLTLKVLLFIASNNDFDFRGVISYIISAIYFIILLIYLLNQFKLTKLNDNQKELKLKQLETLSLIKKVLFLIFLICFQYQSILQSLSLSMLILCYIILIVVFRVKNSYLEITITIWIEVPILIFTSISLVYIQEFQDQTDDDQKIAFAFAQVSFLIIGLFAPLCKNVFIFLNKIKQKYYVKKKQISKKQIEKQPNKIQIANRKFNKNRLKKPSNKSKQGLQNL